MRAKRHDIEFLICLIVMLALIFLTVFSLRARILYRTYNDNGETKALVYDVTGNLGSYDIKTEYKNYEVNMIGERAFLSKSHLRNVSLPETIEKIGKLAFSECSRLEVINLENVLEIETHAFSYCSSLDNIILNVEEINSSTFFKATSLKNISLNNTKRIYSFAFAYTSIEELVLPSTVNIATGLADGSFYYMESLTKISVYSTTLKTLIENNYSKYLNKDGVEIEVIE